jgi:hypothetical protein
LIGLAQLDARFLLLEPPNYNRGRDYLQRLHDVQKRNVGSQKVIHYERQGSGYLDDDLVRYKTCGWLVRDTMTRERYPLLKRDYSSLFLWACKIIDTVLLWSTYLKLILLRVWHPLGKRQ